MSQNPDIDRISLDKRIEAGASSGGSGSGAGSGIPGRGFIMTARDIEAATNNNVTKINAGWILKFSIPTTDGGGNTYTGVAIHGALYIPEFEGKPLGTAQVAIVFHRKGRLQWQQSQKKSFSKTIPMNNPDFAAVVSGKEFSFRDDLFSIWEQEADNPQYSGFPFQVVGRVTITCSGSSIIVDGSFEIKNSTITNSFFSGWVGYAVALLPLITPNCATNLGIQVGLADSFWNGSCSYGDSDRPLPFLQKYLPLSWFGR